MSTTTAFLSTVINAFPTNAPDPFYTQWCDTINEAMRFNISQRMVDSFGMDAGQTRVFTPTALVTTDQQLLMIKVIGSVQVQTVGVDAASAAIAGWVPVYGTTILPGILLLSTKDVSSYTLACNQDSSGVELFIGHSEADA